MARGLYIGGKPAWSSTPVFDFSTGTPQTISLATYLHNPRNRSITYSAPSGLPTGCSISGASFIWNGNGTASTGTITLRATSNQYTTDISVAYTIIAGGWTTIPDQSLTVGVPFTLALANYDPADTGSYSVNAGGDTLPAGLTLNTSTGVISGTPTTAQTKNVAFDATPTAEADWLARSTAAGVVVAYDFSAPPANGGTWDYGSLKASPKVTCEVYSHAYDDRRYVDTSVYPPGSTASLLFSVPTNSGEAGDQWRISIDDYADQFGAGDTFWVQWRCRMNSAMATTLFLDETGSPTYTGFKHTFFGAGMQTPVTAESFGQPYDYYGYEGPGTQSSNQLRNTRSDSIGEIVMRNFNGTSPVPFKYPGMYTSKEFFQSLASEGDANYVTHRNEGNESSHTAACQYHGGTGAFTDYSTCFIYPADQWFTMMTKVTLGTYGTAASSLGGTLTGYTNSTCEYYGQMEAGQPMTLLHRRTGVVFQTYEGTPQGSEGKQKYGIIAWTTFMTRKDATQVHGTANMWVGQVIISTQEIAAPAA